MCSVDIYKYPPLRDLLFHCRIESPSAAHCAHNLGHHANAVTIETVKYPVITCHAHSRSLITVVIHDTNQTSVKGPYIRPEARFTGEYISAS